MALTETDDEFSEKVHDHTLNNRYADIVIDRDPSRFDAIEIHGVRDLGDGTCEQDDDDPDFYSVYLHLKEGGITCVGDHSLVEDARSYARKLSAKYAWPITYSE